MTDWLSGSPELTALWNDLSQPGAFVASGLLAVTLALAWAVVRFWRGPQAPPGSIWFGRGIFDGVLFPMLWLAFAWAAESLTRHWRLPLGVFRIVIPVLVSLLVIRLSVRVLSAAFPNSRLMRMAERTISWLAWGTLVLWITGILPIVLDALDDIHWKAGNGTVTLRNVVEGTLSAGLVLVLALWISAAIETKLLRGAIGGQLSLRKAAANTVRALLVLVGLLFALSAVGIDLTALSVLGGAVGVGLGFGLQKLAANYVSGFVILAERSLRIGDYVKVDGFEGRITDIATRYTVLRSVTGREAIVPNEMLITQRVESQTLADSRVLLTTVVQVAGDTDLAALFPAIAATVAATPRVVADPAPAIQLSAFAADGLELTVVFWIVDPENGSGGVRSDVNLALLGLFRERGVVIPSPQRIVTLAAGTAPAAPPAAPDLIG